MKNLTTIMIIYLSLGLTIILFSCNGTNGKSEGNNASQTVLQKEKNEVENGIDLKQNGDYSTLFNRDVKDCQVLSVEELAEALDVPVSSVTNENNGLNSCNYYVTENGKSTRFYFSVEQWGNEMIRQEIQSAKEDAETFGKDSRLSQYKISESGDTYLSMHQDRKVRILNENNNNAIIVLYEAKIEPGEKDVEKINRLMDEARNRAYSTANYILKKYKE